MNEALLPALLLTGCIGAAIAACFQAAQNFGKSQPACLRCNHEHEDHEWRFGDRGLCRRCFCFRYERPA